MNTENTAIHHLIRQAMTDAEALSSNRVNELRQDNARAIRYYKIFFWVMIVIFNVLLWVPLPIGQGVLIGLAVFCLACALLIPIFGIRKHQGRLLALQDVPNSPKKSRASQSGRDYITDVRQQGRSFVKAEVDVLENSRESTS